MRRAVLLLTMEMFSLSGLTFTINAGITANESVASRYQRREAEIERMIRSGRSGSALNEAIDMCYDSQRQQYQHGLASAYYYIGLANLKKGQYSPAEEALHQALILFETRYQDERDRLCDVYAAYCHTLLCMFERRQWREKMAVALDRWQKYLNRQKQERTEETDGSWLLLREAQLLSARAARARMTGSGETAGKLLDRARRLVAATSPSALDTAVSIDVYDCYARYLYSEGQTALALTNIRRAADLSRAVGDVGTLLHTLALEQRLYEKQGERDKALLTRAERDAIARGIDDGETAAVETGGGSARDSTLFVIAAVIMVAATVILVAVSLRRRQMVRRLKESTKRLRAANKELEEANRRAIISLEAKKRFIRTISHEIRTPLNIISGFTQVLDTPGITLSDSQREHIIEDIDMAAKDVTNIIFNLIKLSDLEKQTEINMGESVAWNETCLEAIKDTGINKKKGLAFSFGTDFSGDRIITTNKEAVTAILKELLANAMKFCPAGNITLRCGEKNARQLFVSVTDNGKCISADDAEHIFEPFVKLNDFYSGVGVGLSVCRLLAQKIGSRVYLDTGYKEGNRFVFETNSYSQR